MKRLLANHRTTLAVLLLIAAVLRLYGLTSQSLSMDECLEIELAGRSIREIVNASNSLPPLYHLLLKGWLMLDSGQSAVRHFSFLTGVLSLFAFWKLAREATDEKTAIIAMGLATVSPFHIYYSQEGRGYGLFLLLATLAVLFGLRIVRQASSRWDALAFVAVSVAGCYTHYYFAVLLMAIGLAVIAVAGLRSAVRQYWPLALSIAVLVGPLFLLLPGDLQHQRDVHELRPASIATVGYTFFSYESGYTLGPSRAALHDMTEAAAATAALPWLAVLVPLISCLLLLGYLCFTDRREVALWFVILLIPLGAVIALCRLFGVTYNTRFAVICWAPYCLLIATGIASLLPRPRVVVCVIFLLIYATALFNRHHVDAYRNEDMRAVAEFLETADPLPVFVSAGYMERPVRRYFNRPDQVIRLADASLAEGSETEALRELDEHEGSFWLVYCRPFHGDPDGKILDWVRRHGTKEPNAQLTGVSIYRCERSTGRTVTYEEPIPESR